MAAPSQQQQSDSSYDLAYIAVFIFALGFGLWHFYHDYIVYYIFKLKLFEARLVDIVSDDLDYNMVLLHALEPSEVTIAALTQLSSEVGDYFKYPIILILGVLAVVLYMKSASTKFKKKYSMKSLASDEKINWPQITPVLNLNLVDQDITKGQWAMSLTPMEYAKKHDLIQVTKYPDIGAKARPPEVKLIQSKARQHFVQQLGPLWIDVKSIPIYSRALFAIFAARINRNRGDADKLIKQLAISSGSQKMSYAGVDAIVDKYIGTKLVQRVVNKHAYYLTIMAEMLAAAREDGVVASADFLWLKPVDRRLWYLLNCVGRQTPFVEIAGPFAHWIAERVYKNKIKSPMIDTALTALDFALTEIVYTEDDE